MNVIAHHIHSIQMKQDLWPEKDQPKWPKNIDSAESIEQQIQIAKLQQQKLKFQADWEGFLHSEWKQLNRYNEVRMFGDPVKRTIDMVILPWVWTYLYKDTEGKLNKDTTKSRGTCNGGPRFCDKSSISETYASCVEQPIH